MAAALAPVVGILAGAVVVAGALLRGLGGAAPRIAPCPVPVRVDEPQGPARFQRGGRG